MPTDRERLEQLETAYRKLWDDHIALKELIRQNYAEFKELRERYGLPAVSPENASPAVRETPPEVLQKQQTVKHSPEPQPTRWPEDTRKEKLPPITGQNKTSWEQYIGEQLLSKIGIAILVIGVGIGAKYAIDHRLLSPVMRIGGGYLIAAVLGFFAYRFREKYTAFSAILTSGAMAVSYFMTYAAHIFYGLYPYWLTFLLLLLTTFGTVYTALRYNLVVIAHIGLVGAYILPALISQQNAHISNYLAYIAVINSGILIIAFLRNWKSLFHVAFGWTVSVITLWMLTSYDSTKDAGIALLYTCLFFVLFQGVALVRPLWKGATFDASDIWLIVPNSIFLFTAGEFVIRYGFQENTAVEWGFGTGIAAFYAAVAWLSYRRLKEDTILYSTHVILAVTALTLTFLFQLETDQLFPVLTLEAVVLGWMAVKTGRQFPDILAVLLLTVSGFCFLINWSEVYSDSGMRTPFLNTAFGSYLLTIILTSAAIHYSHRRIRGKDLLVLKGLPAFVLSILFLLVLGDLMLWLNQRETDLPEGTPPGYFNPAYSDLLSKVSLITAYVVSYVAFTGIVTRYYLNMGKTRAGLFGMVFAYLALIVYSVVTISDLQVFRNANTSAMLYFAGHYIGFGAIVLIWLKLVRPIPKQENILPFLHVGALWMLSLEMLQWLNYSGHENAYKLSLSLLWATYAIYIMYLGIRRTHVSMRVISMIILGITLLKLFFYDIARLSTLSKTIVFIGIGGLLLVGAYFYQRFRKAIQEEQKDAAETFHPD